jgi:hypothetical protein
MIFQPKSLLNIIIMFVNKKGDISNASSQRKFAYKQGDAFLERISKNYIRGMRIENIDEIRDLAGMNKAIYHSGMGIRPAAIFYQWSLAQLDIAIHRGYFSLIVKV